MLGKSVFFELLSQSDITSSLVSSDIILFGRCLENFQSHLEKRYLPSYSVLSVEFFKTSIFQDTYEESHLKRSCPEVFCKTGAVRNFTKLALKRLWYGLFFNKVVGLRPATLLKRESHTDAFLSMLQALCNFFQHCVWGS